MYLLQIGLDNKEKIHLLADFEATKKDLINNDILIRENNKKLSEKNVKNSEAIARLQRDLDVAREELVSLSGQVAARDVSIGELTGAAVLQGRREEAVVLELAVCRASKDEAERDHALLLQECTVLTMNCAQMSAAHEERQVNLTSRCERLEQQLSSNQRELEELNKTNMECLQHLTASEQLCAAASEETAGVRARLVECEGEAESLRIQLGDTQLIMTAQETLILELQKEHEVKVRLSIVIFCFNFTLQLFFVFD